MHESTEAQAAFASAVFVSAGEIDWPDPTSPVDQAAARSHTRRLAGRPGPYHDPLDFHLSRTMDQERLSYWWRFTLKCS